MRTVLACGVHFCMNRRTGFTLVELVVVILILGILAGVAAPKLFDTSGKATDNGLRQTLKVVRNAIDIYAANNNGALPGADNQEATFKADLALYLRKFPENPKAADPAKADQVKMIAGPLDIIVEVDEDKGWIYHSGRGLFKANTNAALNDGGGAASGL